MTRKIVSLFLFAALLSTNNEDQNCSLAQIMEKLYTRVKLIFCCNLKKMRLLLDRADGNVATSFHCEKVAMFRQFQ